MKSIITDHKFCIFICLLVILIISGCSTGSTTVSAPEVVDATPESTIEPSPEPSSTPTQPEPTATQVPPTETPTPTQTNTSTTTSTPTATSQPPGLVVNEATACRTGPGMIYAIRAYINAGTVPTLLGTVADNEWWSVKEPEFNAECWISSSVVTLNGDLESLPEFTPEPTPTAELSPTEVQKGVIYYLVMKDTGGTLGCGDTLIPVYTGVPRSGNLEKDIQTGLHALLKLKVKEFGGYYNPLYNAHLSTGGIEFNKDSGNVKVNLNGSIPKPKDECEYYRVRAVLWETVRHYRDVTGVTFWIGDKLIGDLIAIIDR